MKEITCDVSQDPVPSLAFLQGESLNTQRSPFSTPHEVLNRIYPAIDSAESIAVTLTLLPLSRQPASIIHYIYGYTPKKFLT